MGQMLSISFTTEPSCVSSLTFMVLGSPPSCETQVTGKIPEPHDGGGEGILFGYTRILLGSVCVELLEYFWWPNVNSIYQGVVRGG